jgi:hypothetical protein
VGQTEIVIGVVHRQLLADAVRALTAFFEIITTLACEINTLGYSKAALFTFCLALLAYNAVSLLKAVP